MIERREGRVERRQKGKGEKTEERKRDRKISGERRGGERIEREKMIRLSYMRERKKMEERGMNIKGGGENNIENLK